MFSTSELIDVIVMTIAVGFIFKDYFKRPQHKNFDPLVAARQSNFKTFLHDIGYAILITAPAVIFHELAHKLTAMSFGLTATFHAAYKFLLVGVFLKLVHSPFLFFVPGYVTHPPTGPIQTMAIAFSGPGLNLLLWIGSAIALSIGKFKQGSRLISILALTARINMFLFFFNMLPIPPFDGFSFFSSLYELVRPLLPF